MFKNKFFFMSLLIIVSYYVLSSILRVPFPYLAAGYGVVMVVLCVAFRSALFAAMANIYYSSGKRDKAKAMFEKAFKHGSKNPAVRLNYAIMTLHNGDAETALDYARQAMALKPDILTEKNARLTIGSSYWVLGKLDEAVAELESMRESFDYVNAHVLSTLGYLYIVTGRPDKAKEITEKALEDDPASGASWDNMGQIYLNEGDLDKAEEAFTKAVSIKKDLVDSHYYLGIIHEKRGDRQKAAECFAQARSCKISSLNTVTREQVDGKYNEYVTNSI